MNERGIVYGQRTVADRFDGVERPDRVYAAVGFGKTVLLEVHDLFRWYGEDWAVTRIIGTKGRDLPPHMHRYQVTHVETGFGVSAASARTVDEARKSLKRLARKKGRAGMAEAVKKVRKLMSTEVQP